MELGEWLRRLGLSQYERAFVDNAIDAEVLAKLTVEDLKELGVTLVGHRRKLLDAIAALPGDDHSSSVARAVFNGAGGRSASAVARRTPATDNPVLRSGWIDRAVDPTRSGRTS